MSGQVITVLLVALVLGMDAFSLGWNAPFM